MGATPTATAASRRRWVVGDTSTYIDSSTNKKEAFCSRELTGGGARPDSGKSLPRQRAGGSSLEKIMVVVHTYASERRACIR